MDGIYFVTDSRGFIYILDDIIQLLLFDPVYKYHPRFKQIVTTIDQTNPSEIVVTTTDGTKYTGEYVLVTFSLGVLQNNLVQFIPPLPEWKIQAFSQFIMGSFTKVLVKINVLHFEKAIFDCFSYSYIVKYKTVKKDIIL